MVSCDTDIDLVVSTIKLALSHVAEIYDDPPSEVEIARVAGRLVIVRALIWHAPEPRARRVAIDVGLRMTLADLRVAGIELDGPTLLDLESMRLNGDSSETM